MVDFSGIDSTSAQNRSLITWTDWAWTDSVGQVELLARGEIRGERKTKQSIIVIVIELSRWIVLCMNKIELLFEIS